MRRGIDFAQAELATKIRGKYLRALEDEQFAVLPAQTYVKGFLRTYAEYLGLDGQLYVDEFNSRFVAGTDEHEPRARRAAATRPQRRHRRFETSLVLIVLAVIAVLTVIFISAWGSGTHTPPATRAKRPVATKPKVTPPLLEIKALRGSTHVVAHRGSATGNIVFDGTVSKGDPPRAIRGSRLWVQIDTPGDLRVLVRGRVVHIPASKPAAIIVSKTGWRPAA